MTLKKGLLIGGVAVGALAAIFTGCIVLVVWWVFSVTAEAAQATDRFLGLLAQGKVAEAYAESASVLQTQQGPETFAAEVQRLGLTDYAQASWSSRSFENDEATLEGSVTTKSGGTLPLQVQLVKENGAWKVLALTAVSAGVGTGASKTIPAEEILRRLTTASLLDFDRAVKAEDFTAFHGTLSTALQQQVTADEVKQAFQQFIDQQIDLAAIAEQSPIFNAAPALDENEMLVLSGYYPTTPSAVRFQLKYAYEHPEWKLFAIEVNVGD